MDLKSIINSNRNLSKEELVHLESVSMGKIVSSEGIGK